MSQRTDKDIVKLRKRQTRKDSKKDRKRIRVRQTTLKQRYRQGLTRDKQGSKDNRHTLWSIEHAAIGSPDPVW